MKSVKSIVLPLVFQQLFLVGVFFFALSNVATVVQGEDVNGTQDAVDISSGISAYLMNTTTGTTGDGTTSDAAATASDAAGAADNLNCTYQRSVTLVQNQLTLQEIVNPVNRTLRVTLTYQGEAWLSFGVPSPATSDDMTGSQIVVGIINGADTVPPEKYLIGNSQSLGAVNPYPTENQTLLFSNILQQDGVTTMSYEKYLEEPGELSISDGSTSQEFVYAVGTGNDFSFHQYRGTFQLRPSTCVPIGSAVPETAGTGDIAIAVDSGSKKTKNLWIAHAYLMMAAFGAFMPLAIGAAMARRFIPGEGNWFTIHSLSNFLGACCCFAGFGIAVYNLDQAGQDHFSWKDGPHRTFGIAITAAVMVQVLLGVCRPHKFTDSHEISIPTQEVEGAADMPEVKVESGPYVSKTRTTWEWTHRILGCVIIGFAGYQVQTGWNLFTNDYNIELFPMYGIIFWAVGGGLLGLGFLAWMAGMFLFSK